METKIDIENFESQDFDTQKYVLTSPRSLRACNDLNIKPEELLPIRAEEIHESIVKQKIPLHISYSIFAKKELDRKEKISKVKFLRWKMIRDEQSNDIEKKVAAFKEKTLASSSIIPPEREIHNSHFEFMLSTTENNQKLKYLEQELLRLKQQEKAIVDSIMRRSIEIRPVSNLSSTSMQRLDGEHSMRPEPIQRSRTAELITRKTVPLMQSQNSTALFSRSKSRTDERIQKVNSQHSKLNQDIEVYNNIMLAKSVDSLERARQLKEKQLMDKSKKLYDKSIMMREIQFENLKKKQEERLQKLVNIYDKHKLTKNVQNF